MDAAFRRAVALARREGGLYFASLLSEDRILQAFGEARRFWQGWIYSPAVTVWVYLSQCLSPDHSCCDAVARLIAWPVLTRSRLAGFHSINDTPGRVLPLESSDCLGAAWTRPMRRFAFAVRSGWPRYSGRRDEWRCRNRRPGRKGRYRPERGDKCGNEEEQNSAPLSRSFWRNEIESRESRFIISQDSFWPINLLTGSGLMLCKARRFSVARQLAARCGIAASSAAARRSFLSACMTRLARSTDHAG